MNKTRLWAMNLAIGAAALAVAACGRSSGPADSAAATGAAPRPEAAAAEDGPARAKPAMTSAEVCRLLSAEQVQAILDANPNPTPQDQPRGGGVSSARCVWDAGGSNGDLSLTVMQVHEGADVQILSAMPMAGEALSGVGEQAGVAVQGNFSVEVMARRGPTVMTLSAMAMGITDRKDAVIAAARSIAAQL